MPYKLDGKTHLLYELHITNFRSRPLELTQVDVFNLELKSEALASLKDAKLAGLITNIGVRKKDSERRIIGAGERLVVFASVSLDANTPVPTLLRHRLYLKPPNTKVAPNTIEDKGISVNTQTPPIINPPLRGDGWVSFNGVSNTSDHRRTLIPVNGKAYIAQRFAIDWAKINPEGKAFEDSIEKNENFYGYGEDLIAVADAIVVDVKDGIPDNDMTAGKPAVRITLDTIGGNYVILDIGNGYHAFYGHLIPGSLAVKKGDKIKVGQVIGKLGNSGNSDAPHLHFHITKGNSPLGAEGVPYLIKSFEVRGKSISGDELFAGKAWKATPNAPKDMRFMEIPSENSVFRFR